MKARFLVEVEIDNAPLAAQFKAELPNVLASGAIELKLAQAIGGSLAGVPHLKDVQVNIIPLALHSDKLS